MLARASLVTLSNNLIERTSSPPGLIAELFNGHFLESICTSASDDLLRQLRTARVTRVLHLALPIPERQDASLHWHRISVAAVWQSRHGLHRNINFECVEGGA